MTDNVAVEAVEQASNEAIQEAVTDVPAQGVPAPQLTQDDLVKLKNISTEQLGKCYLDFVNALAKIPAHATLKRDGLLFINAGYGLLKEAILGLGFPEA